MKPTGTVFLILSVCVWFLAFAGTACSAETGQITGQQLRETIERHFDSMDGVQDGDLICQSQVDEVQQYLRRTQGHIPATHPRLFRRALPDLAPLVRFFYMDGGADVLREAAQQLHGYGQLHALSLTGAGRAEISTAIESKNPQLLIKLVTERAVSPTSPEQGDRQPHTANSHIFTLQQFLEAALSPAGVEEAAAGRN